MNSKLSKNIDDYLATLSNLYAKNNNKLLQKIIVNSQIKDIKEWDSYNNGNGGIIYGYALTLVIPKTLYHDIAERKDKFESKIRDDISNINDVRDQYIEKVFLKMEVEEDWRIKSDLLLPSTHAISSNALNRIWEKQKYRVFLSHKADFKEQTKDLKTELSLYGITCFVAHEDIEPTQKWQNEIENALFSMDAFVALLTNGFHDSLWTDQEIGVAYGRKVPIIAVKHGTDPYGFIGKFQALPFSEKSINKEIVKLLIKRDCMIDAYIKAVHECRNFTDGNILSEILPFINKLSDQQAHDLISAYNENGEVSGSFGFNGKKPSEYGDGLIHHLYWLTGRTYKLSANNKIIEEVEIPF